jgi:hypothetical protein
VPTKSVASNSCLTSQQLRSKFCFCSLGFVILITFVIVRYEELVKVLSFAATLPDEAVPIVVYHLLLQDRVEEVSFLNDILCHRGGLVSD